MANKHRRIYTDNKNNTFVWFKTASCKKENICIAYLNNKQIFNGILLTDITGITKYYNNISGDILSINSNNNIIFITKKINNTDTSTTTYGIQIVDSDRLIIIAKDENENQLKIIVKDEAIRFDDNFNTYDQINVKDALINALSIIKGELWYNKNYGLPLFDKNKIKSIIDAEVINIISNNPEVDSIINFNSQLNGNSYILDFSIKSIYSPDLINISLVK